jgi:prophage regulatory protein
MLGGNRRKKRKMDSKDLLTLAEVLALVRVSRATWYSGIKAGRYPKPVRISARLTRWRRADIDKLLESLQP